MRLIGLIGGMSWQSTGEYYRLINQMVGEALGGHHSARCLIYSVDFHDIERFQSDGDWDAAGRLLAEAAVSLESAGADILLLCTNTMHRVALRVTQEVTIPFLHIGSAVADRISAGRMGTVGLLGTRYTMEEGFYREMLAERSVEVLIPEATQREMIHQVIYDELVFGRIETRSRGRYLEVIQDLSDRGAEGVILGCTEIPLLVGPEHTDVPLFDTTRIHAEEAVTWARESPS